MTDAERRQRIDELCHAALNQAVQQRLATDIRALEEINGQINQLNDRVLPIVKTLTGQDLGAEPDKWKGWWTDQLGYVYQSSAPRTKPTYTDMVSVWSPFTVGATQRVKNMELTLFYQFMQMIDRTVNVAANAAQFTNGDYRNSAHLAGAGLRMYIGRQDR